MPSVKRYMNITNGWEQTSAAVKAHESELEDLGTFCARLDVHLGQARSLYNEQGAYRASKQETTKRLMEVLRSGNVIADLVRTGIREHYGADSEMLIEFGIEPFRGKKRTTAPAPTTPEPEPEAELVEALRPASTPDTVK